MLRIGDELITLTDPDAPAAEAYRTLRTNILMRNFDKDMKVINIISTTAQEGKSTCVLNLAMVYAQLQKKVLVIDLDLRMPTIHKKLKLKNKKGISDIIGHQAEFDEVVLQPYENVDVITAGTKIPFASEFIQSKALKEFIDNKRREYDLVLLDCPPVGLVTDGVVAASYCDGTILVCASNRNDRKELLRVKDQLEQTQINVVGIVMTMMPVQRKYYSSYGYRYSESQKRLPAKKKKPNFFAALSKKNGKKK
ncbi:CpsD/CapB family tyrosine-protein kinase [Holdemania massiliensis]|uniref:non-specific protein-tyrosine kinase n=1 Tax=Holdemania massiliensis TaxID=1468449 RepID=A0A6N7S3K7_9FIRM|nr:CpsD/CapB family tyrosine-protein kinase [Holdemania massiliensis]MSA70584.1 polysaccharide biosynthesis tyrosine autokinase [Holdemania massiliensis]MSA88457.1 polysaccharide biosynthesis tyrosine autokinase [Holdemania massiliensis]MSB77643.1 polysaccharide biosynthesis tyrosine autokinase [Holdemania massiliensis]MSC32569.1 polysaccharide biosynthesis tyrosine autokinase [Holdemania massiliensis]MSC38889.1 polysaccharide biosynthesis tyrosine autokinase [Holdemania massiliensis]